MQVTYDLVIAKIIIQIKATEKLKIFKSYSYILVLFTSYFKAIGNSLLIVDCQKLWLRVSCLRAGV